MPFPARLIEGYRAFLDGTLRSEQDRYRELAERGQSPEVLLIGCCDSRCAPETIFNARPGELFVVRNIANVVPSYAPEAQAREPWAALEFAVVALKVKHIVVLGHAQCGGVKAFAQKSDALTADGFITKWMALMAPAAEKVGPRATYSAAGYVIALEQANIVNSLDNLMTFPWLRETVERGELTLHGAYFGVATGELSVLDRVTGQFAPVAAEEYAQVLGKPRF